MHNKLKQYTILLSIRNINSKSNPNALKRITDELGMRPHLQCKSISQIGDGGVEEIVTELIFWGLSKASTAEQAAEELFEIVGAILDYPQGISVHIL